jgi:LPXTG-motif cell wall-anchored protein
MVRRILLIAAAVLAVGSISLSSAGAGGNYGGCSATVSDTSPEPGQEITVEGSGAADGGTVSATLDGTEVGTGTADAQGDFTFTATIPSTATGSETLAVSCGPNRGTFPITLTVVAGSGTLPATGSDSLPLAWIGLGVLAAGATVMGGARLRARTAGHGEL